MSRVTIANALKRLREKKEGLRDQLEYEGFTAEQIEHALEAVGY